MQEMNYTQISNEFIESLQTLTGASVKVFLAISRQTIGWHKTSDRVSYSQLIKMTGISSHNTIQKAINELIRKGFINQKNTRLGYVYDLNIMSKNDTVKPEGVSISDTVGVKKCHNRVSISDTTKEKKETKQKKYNETYKELTNSLKRNIDSILGNNNLTSKETWFDRSYNEIRKLIEIDKIDVSQVRDIISYLPYNDFWSKNILSGAKLRKHFYRLMLEFKSKNKIINKIDFSDYEVAK